VSEMRLGASFDGRSGILYLYFQGIIVRNLVFPAISGGNRQKPAIYDVAIFACG
jgi:hypothetical protein